LNAILKVIRSILNVLLEVIRRYYKLLDACRRF